MECHFQLFLDDAWVDCATATLVAPANGDPRTGSFFEYDLDYAFRQASEPLSLRFPVTAEVHVLKQWPAFLFDLVPQGSGRKYLLGELALSDSPAADFPLICAGAFNPIGRVRVKEAVRYYAAHLARHAASRARDGFSMEEIIARGDAFNERMLIHSMLAAGSLGAQGAAPKYLLTTDRDGKWHADGALADDRAAEHFIVKRPRGKSPADSKVLRNEAAYMEVARLMGIRTFGDARYRDDTLFIPRFDRQVVNGKVLRRHQESAASLVGMVGFDERPDQFTMLAALRRACTDKTAETVEFLKRDVLNLAMRNTDNHARNTAVQDVGGRIQLTPLFDFGPMYLDPEGIARTARWHHPQTRVELSEWRDVLAALDTDDAERRHLARELHRFGTRLPALERYMRQAGVDDDIIAFLRQHIATQMRQLRALGEDGHGAH